MSRPLDAIGAVGYPATGAADAVLVLAHGAGAGQRHPFMVTLGTAFAAAGVDVATFDFPYMRQGRRVPDRAPVLEEAFREAVAAARGWSRAGRLFIGGKSMGGRIATHLAAEGVEGLAGVVVFGYPLHPPGRPDRPRTAHLASIGVPVMIVQGERDTFGGPAEVAAAFEALSAPVRLLAVAGGDHSLAVRRRPREEVLGDVVAAARGWMAEAASRT